MTEVLRPGIGWAARRMRGKKGLAQRLIGRAG
jgi:hypothetical protein